MDASAHRPTVVRLLPVAAQSSAAGAFVPPQRMSGEAAGFDVCAAVASPVLLEPGARALVPCGFRMEMPAGFEAQVRPRSGLAVKHGITCLNAPGTIDADFRGEVHVLLVNHGQAPFAVEAGMRIAQLVFAALTPVTLTVVDTLSDSARGERGFGSTGS